MDKLKIGDIVKKKGEDGYFVITSEPWRIGDGAAVKIAPVPQDGLYLLEDVRGCVRCDMLEKAEKFCERSKEDEKTNRTDSGT